MFSRLGWQAISVLIGPVLLRGLLRGLGLGILFGTILGVVYQHRMFGLVSACAILVLSLIGEIPTALRRYRGAVAMEPLSRFVEAYLGEAPVDIVRSTRLTSNLDPDIAVVTRSKDGTRQFSWTPADRRMNEAPGPHFHLSIIDPETDFITANYCVVLPKD